MRCRGQKDVRADGRGRKLESFTPRLFSSPAFGIVSTEPPVRECRTFSLLNFCGRWRVFQQNGPKAALRISQQRPFGSRLMFDMNARQWPRVGAVALDVRLGGAQVRWECDTHPCDVRRRRRLKAIRSGTVVALHNLWSIQILDQREADLSKFLL